MSWFTITKCRAININIYRAPHWVHKKLDLLTAHARQAHAIPIPIVISPQVKNVSGKSILIKISSDSDVYVFRLYLCCFNTVHFTFRSSCFWCFALPFFFCFLILLWASRLSSLCSNMVVVVSQFFIIIDFSLRHRNRSLWCRLSTWLVCPYRLAPALFRNPQVVWSCFKRMSTSCEAQLKSCSLWKERKDKRSVKNRRQFHRWQSWLFSFVEIQITFKSIQVPRAPMVFKFEDSQALQQFNQHNRKETSRRGE